MASSASELSLSARRDNDGDTHGVRLVKSSDRTLALLEYLSASPTPRSLREIAQDLQLPKASAHALLLTMCRRGWAEPDRRSGGFRLGLRALRVGMSYVGGDEVVVDTTQLMDDLSDQLSETIHLARLDGSDVVYLATRPSRHALSFVAPPGRRLPAWVTALGKALLAERKWAEVDQLLPDRLTRLTPNTFATRASLRTELQEIATRGYSIDNEESTEGLRCFAVALPYSSPAMDALSCSVPMARLNADKEQNIISSLQSVRQRVFSRVGRGPAPE